MLPKRPTSTAVSVINTVGQLALEPAQELRSTNLSEHVAQREHGRHHAEKRERVDAEPRSYDALRHDENRNSTTRRKAKMIQWLISPRGISPSKNMAQRSSAI